MKKRLLIFMLTITAIFMCILGLSACVNTPSTVSVSSVSLNRTYITVEIGDTVSLYETVYPSNATDKSVVWNSSNPSVATVSNGTVTAKSAGTATITVRTSNDKTATCVVTVNEKIIAVNSVSLSQTSVTLTVDDTVSLYETVYPSNATDKNVVWNSSNPSVATVSNGTVTAKSAGTATITVRTSNDKTATCVVTVNEKIIAVNSVSLSQTSVTLTVDDTVSLYETVYPSNATDKNVVWNSSNPSVATVSNGTVTAKSAGTATITVRTSNDKTATCVVTVNEKIIAVNSVSLSQTSVTLTVDDTVSLYETVYPSNATNKSVVWGSSNPSVATVSNGTVTAKSAGTATIIVRTSNDKTATCFITVNPKEILPTSIYLNKSSIDLDEGAEETLTVTLLPSDTTNRNIEWIILDTSVATVSNGTITAVGEGTTTLIATTHNGLTATCMISVTPTFVFVEYGDGYALKAYSGTDTEVVVPSTYKGKNVIAIGVQQTGISYVASGFANCTNVQKIVLPDTISTIQYAAFYNCINLKCINIPNSVQLWGYYALYNCNSLEEISVSLDKFEFVNYFVKATVADYKIPESLTTVKITGTRVPDNAFSELTNLTSIEISDSVTSIGSYAFEYCSSLTSISIGDDVASIGDYAFASCSGLTEIVIPNSVTAIGSCAFQSCSSLTSVSIGDGVASIGGYAFSGCSGLTEIVIPNSVTYIGTSAFWGCSSLIIYCEDESCPSKWNYYWERYGGEWSNSAQTYIRYYYLPVYWYSENQPAITGDHWHYDENGEIAVWGI